MVKMRYRSWDEGNNVVRTMVSSMGEKKADRMRTKKSVLNEQKTKNIQKCIISHLAFYTYVCMCIKFN